MTPTQRKALHADVSMLQSICSRVDIMRIEYINAMVTALCRKINYQTSLADGWDWEFEYEEISDSFPYSGIQSWLLNRYAGTLHRNSGAHIQGR